MADPYSPQTGSPAKDAGTDVGVTTDIEGTARPQGPAPDIGAFEFTETAPPGIMRIYFV